MTCFAHVSDLVLQEPFITARDIAVVYRLDKSARTDAVHAASARLQKHLQMQGGKGKFLKLKEFKKMSIISKLRVLELFAKSHLLHLSAALQDADNILSLTKFHFWVNTVWRTEGMWATTLLLRMHGSLNNFLGRRLAADYRNMPPMTLLNLCVANFPWESPAFADETDDYDLLPVKCLLAAGADATKIWGRASIIQKRQYGSPLFMAARRGLDPVVRLLLDHGENPNVWNCDDITPLFMAVIEHKVGVVRLLLAAGAKKNTGCERRTSLSTLPHTTVLKVTHTLLEVAVEEEEGLQKSIKKYYARHPSQGPMFYNNWLQAKEIVYLLR